MKRTLNTTISHSKNAKNGEHFIQMDVPCYDNNGNIVRYLDANGNTVAQYTYDAFGRIAAQSGSLANSFCHRFSTKYFESETGLYYYGYRFYSPSLMRWQNRDPKNLRHGSMVTVLNISGHGLQFGSGVSFANKSEFDVGKSYNDLKLLLARNATIRIWSCDAASTYKKCSNLKTAADALDAVIYANTGSVMAGPDGDALSRMFQRVVAWVVGTTQGEWRRFTPRPKIKSRGLYPGPRAFKISKSERKIND